MSVQESRALQSPHQPSHDRARAAEAADIRVWLLLDDRPGHVTQVVGLADALGWPYETKALRFTWLNRLSNRLLGASLAREELWPLLTQALADLLHLCRSPLVRPSSVFRGR